MAFLLYIIASVVAVVLLDGLWQVIPGTVNDGEFSVNGPEAILYLVIAFGYIIAMIWSGICVGVKRCHDRNKSGWFILIQLVPLVGPIWYFVELGCLRGTIGPNRFGEDPLVTAPR